jgi:5'-nucleotidase
MSIPSIAVSLIGRNGRNGRQYDFEKSASLVRSLVEILLQMKMLPKTYLSINIPPFPVKGIKITRLGERRYSPELIKKKDPRGKTYFWIGVGNPEPAGPKDSDVQVVERGWVSITPLQIDRTAHSVINSQLLCSLKNC